MRNLERLKKIIRDAIGSTLPQHQKVRLAEQIAKCLYNEGFSTSSTASGPTSPQGEGYGQSGTPVPTVRGKATVLPKSEYSEEFDKLRKNRVELSFYKYGPARDNFGGGRVEALKTAKLCIEAFEKDKNTEHLVDAANYLMFRFMYPYEGEYFKTTDSSGSVGTVGTPINMEG